MTPHYSDAHTTIWLGDAREALAAMEPESVDCVITSPPYFGLRDYGLPMSSWGGDPEHEHGWESYSVPTQSGGTGASTLGAASGGHGISPDGIERSQVRQARESGTAALCECGAWCGQLGLEPDPFLFVEHLVAVFAGIRRVLKPTGVAWLNLGDSYANDGKWGGHTGGKHVKALHDSPIGRMKRYTGFKPKDRMMIPARAAIALQDDGWWLRDEIVWHKPNPMPSSVEDRTTPAHEMVYLLTKSARYAYDAEAIAELAAYAGPNGAQHSPYGQGFTRRSAALSFARATKEAEHPNGAVAQHRRGRAESEAVGLTRNKRSVWTIATEPYPEAHFATFPQALVEPMIRAGCPLGGVVLDPFGGSGTVALVAERIGRRAVHIDASPEYVDQAIKRIAHGRAEGRGPAVDMPVPFAADGLWAEGLG